jgi:hypothetical protein
MTTVSIHIRKTIPGEASGQIFQSEPQHMTDINIIYFTEKLQQCLGILYYCNIKLVTLSNSLCLNQTFRSTIPSFTEGELVSNFSTVSDMDDSSRSSSTLLL